MNKFLAVASACIYLGLSQPANAVESESFRQFLRSFFTDASFQLQRVQFPLEWHETVANEDAKGEPFVERVLQKTRSKWKHIDGPAYFKCETDCYDLVIYDNFQQRLSQSTERAVAFEGVGNGINITLFFKEVNGKWMLVKYVDEST